MKIIIITSLYFISLFATAQKAVTAEFDGHSWNAPYDLSSPKDWGIERFSIPISFAKKISYKGVEDIRFAPGWAKASSENYWSYAFLWYLDDKIKINAKEIESNLQIYYTGLINANGSAISSETVIPVVTSFIKTKKESGDLNTFVGTIKMLDYMGNKPILLNCKVHQKVCFGENKTLLFYELSPQPLSHTIWQSLDKLWLDFKCKKE